MENPSSPILFLSIFVSLNLLRFSYSRQGHYDKVSSFFIPTDFRLFSSEYFWAYLVSVLGDWATFVLSKCQHSNHQSYKPLKQIKPFT